MTSKKLKTPLCSDKFYHIYNRGNNRENIFHYPSDYYFFIGKYLKYVGPVAETYAYCLLPNHFHFLIKTRYEIGTDKSIVPNQLRKVFICHTARINYFQKRTGGLFTKNYQRIEVTDENYLTHLVRYIHRNPARHGIQRDFATYPFSSYQHLLDESPEFLSKEEVFYWFGGKMEFIEFHHTEDINPMEGKLLNIDEDDL